MQKWWWIMMNYELLCLRDRKRHSKRMQLLDQLSNYCYKLGSQSLSFCILQQGIFYGRMRPHRVIFERKSLSSFCILCTWNHTERQIETLHLMQMQGKPWLLGLSVARAANWWQESQHEEMLLAEALRQAIAQEAEVQACGMPWDVDGWSPKWFEGWFCCEKLGGCFSFGSWTTMGILCLESCKFLLTHVVALSLVYLMTYLQFGCWLMAMSQRCEKSNNGTA